MQGRRNKYGLTPKQEAFAHAYVRLGNASEAYRQAYESNGNGDTVRHEGEDLLANPHVSPRIDFLAQLALEAAEATDAYIIAALKGESDHRNDYADSPGARVQALDRLARIKGMMVDRSEVAIAGRIEHTHPDMANLSEAELRALAQMPSDAEPKALGPGE